MHLPTHQANTGKMVSIISKSIMRSRPFPIPKYHMPLRLRPWFIVFTCFIMSILAFLGFTSTPLPLNDKALHFFCFMVATGLFYFIFDVEEESRRIWFWRHWNIVATTAVCCFLGGIVSEFVQSVLPYKEFQLGDIVANLMGSTIGMSISFYLERYYRRRREIARLYQPVGESPDSDSEQEDTQLLPLHSPSIVGGKPAGKGKIGLGLAHVWDEREELFGIGDSDEEDGEGGSGGGRRKSEQTVRTSPLPPTPKILVTAT